VGSLLAAAERLVRVGAALALAAASAAMFVQVIARFVFSAPIVWAEEFAVLMFAWITFLGAAAVQADDSHLSIDTLRGALPPRGRAVLDAFRRLVIAGTCAILIWQGIALSLRMWVIQFPAMEVTRAWLYLSVPVGFAFSLAFALRALARREKPRRVDDLAG
jgi:TRAP-type C4-dicarboxylate transport system permease small subunit